MARRDVIMYFLEVQNQYMEMVENVKDLEDALKGNFIDQEQFDAAQTEIKVLKDNYERLAYILMLLNKPKRKSKQVKEEKQNKEWYDYLKGASKEAILDENKDALADLKKIIKEIKDGQSK